MAEKQDKKAQWTEMAATELKGQTPETLRTRTAEGIDIAPLYTSSDLEGLEHLDSLPGEAPFTRGPRATMYTVRPWTIRQYAGFSTAEETNKFFHKALNAGQRVCLLPLIWLPIAAMIQTMHGYAVMLARPALLLIQLKI